MKNATANVNDAKPTHTGWLFAFSTTSAYAAITSNAITHAAAVSAMAASTPCSSGTSLLSASRLQLLSVVPYLFYTSYTLTFLYI